MKLEKNYRLQFNEEKQAFHLGNLTYKKDAPGWYTIFKHCSEMEYVMFKLFLDCYAPERITEEYVCECALKIEAFTNKWLNAGIVINLKENIKKGEKAMGFDHKNYLECLKTAKNY